MSVAYNPLSGNFETKEPGPQGPAGTVSAAGDGSQGTPSISFASDTDTGLYKYAADGIGVSTGGTGRLFIDSNGNVGIGTPSPEANRRLTVDIGTTSANPAVFKSQNAGGGSYIGFMDKDTANGNRVRIGAVNDDMAIITAGLESARIDSSGRVGIGTSSPGQQMVVRGSQPFLEIRDSRTGNWSGEDVFSGILFGTDDTTTAVDPHAFIKAVHTRAGTGHSSADAGLTFGTSASTGTPAVERMRIDAITGAVGIGTTSPVARFETNVTSDGAESARFRISGLTNNPIMRFLHHESVGHQIDLNGTTANATQLYVTQVGTERLRIDSSGRLLVGASSPLETAAGRQLQVSDANGAFLVLGRNDTSVGDGPSLGGVHFYGNDTTNNDWTKLAEINCSSDGVQGPGDNPTKLTFSTTADGASSPTERMTIDSSGNVGIGTTSPTSKLHVEDTTNTQLRIFNADDSVAILDFHNTGSTDRQIKVQSGEMYFTAGASEHARIDSSGNVGIGTTGPGTKFHVVTGANAGITVNQTLATGSWSAGDYTQISLGVNNQDTVQIRAIQATSSASSYASDIAFINRTTNTMSEKARIDSSGRLLVGTSSTSSNAGVVIQGASGGSDGILKLASDNATPADGEALGTLTFSASNHSSSARIITRRDGGTWTAGSSEPTRLEFSTTADGASSPTERMRITSEGDLYFSCTNTTKTNAGFRVENNGIPNVSRGTAGTFMEFFHTGNGLKIGSITNSGGVGTAYNTSSDYRLKENVTPVTDGITRLQQLKPSRFNFIADPDKTVDGFLAHEVQTIVPEAITGEKDAVDDEGNPQYQGIDQSKLVPLLTAALQEAIAKIETLEAKVAALEAG